MILSNDDHPLSEEELKTFKTNYGFQLPSTYEKLILKYNGGFPDRNIFQQSSVHFLPIKYGNFNIEECIDALDSDLRPEKYVPFADGDGCVFMFDGSGAPFSVYQLYEDSDIVKVADTFDDFINALEFDEDYL